MSDTPPQELGTAPRESEESIVVDGLRIVIRVCVLLVALVLWGAIGIMMWVPLLFRAVALLAWSICWESIVGRRVHHSEARLRKATGFYIDGFKRTFEAVYSPTVEQTEKDAHGFRVFSAAKDSPEIFDPEFFAFLMELLFVVVFWLSVGGLVALLFFVVRAAR